MEYSNLVDAVERGTIATLDTDEIETVLTGLLSRSPDEVHASGPRKNSFLHCLAQRGELNLLPPHLWKRELLELKDQQGLTIVHLAAEAGKLSDIPPKLLTEEDFLNKAKNGATPCYYAAKSGCLNHIPKSCQNPQIYLVKDQEGIDPLLVAATRGNLQQISPDIRAQLRLLNGFQTQDARGKNILHLAALAKTIDRIPPDVVTLGLLQTKETAGDPPLHHILISCPNQIFSLPTQPLKDFLISSKARPEVIAAICREELTPFWTKPAFFEVNTYGFSPVELAILANHAQMAELPLTVDPAQVFSLLKLAAKHNRLHLFPVDRYAANYQEIKKLLPDPDANPQTQVWLRELAETYIRLKADTKKHDKVGDDTQRNKTVAR